MMGISALLEHAVVMPDYRHAVTGDLIGTCKGSRDDGIWASLIDCMGEDSCRITCTSNSTKLQPISAALRKLRIVFSL